MKTYQMFEKQTGQPFAGLITERSKSVQSDLKYTLPWFAIFR